MDEREKDEKPVIQRGAGMRLSTTAAPITPQQNDFDTDDAGSDTDNSENTTSRNSDIVIKQQQRQGKDVVATKSAANEPIRKASGYKLRIDLTSRLKAFASLKGLAFQVALEEAIEEYLEHHKGEVPLQ